MKKTYLDEIREREQRNQLLLWPIAVLSLFVMAGITWMSTVSSVNFKGSDIYDLALKMWFTSLTLAGGLASFCLIVSLTVLFFIARLAKKLGGNPHPYRPILLSAKFLLVGFALLLLAVTLERQIRINVHSINSWVDNTIGYNILYYAVTIVWMFIFALVSSFIFVLNIFAISLPFKVKAFIEIQKFR